MGLSLMSKLKLVATTQPTVEVGLQTKTHQMVKARCEEHAQLGKRIKTDTARQKRIREEIDTLFTKDGQGTALVDGTSLDGHKMKWVFGKRKVFDQMGFMKKHGVTQEDFDEFTTYNNNEPYIKMSAPGEKGDE